MLVNEIISENYRFVGNCVGRHTEPFLEDMMDNAVEVSYRTLVNAVGLDEIKELFPDYAWGQRGLQLRDDANVAYFRSVYDGKKCYYVQHSRIEYIFVEDSYHFNEDVDTSLKDGLDLTSFETFMNSLRRVPKEQVEALNALLMQKREEANRHLSGLTELYHGAPDHHAHDIKTNGFKLTTGERGSFMGGVREVQNQGIFLTDSKAMAGYFGSNRSKYGNDYKTLPCYVDTSHVLDYERAPRSIVHLGLKILNEYHGSTLTKIPKGEWWWLLDEPEFVDALKGAGFTGVKFQEHIAIRREINQSFNGDATTAYTYLIFDPSMVKQRKGISVEDFYEMLIS